MIRKSSSRQVKSVRTGFRIIEILQNHDGAGLDDVARQLGLAKSTIHNYLSTLESMGYVVERGGDYHLGLRFLTHGMAAKSRLRIRSAVGEALSDLAASVEQPAWWVVEENGRGLFVESAVQEGGTPVYGRVGKRSYLHTHAPGKAILAALPDAYVEEIIEYHGLPVHTKETIDDGPRLTAELDRIRERGYAVSNDEAALGIQSVGVAFDGPVAGGQGIGIFGYSHDFSTPPDREVTAALDRAVASIESAIDAEED
ncbi:MAG: IclR family transcriptional regulator [Natronomonas sp.]|jgi:DNA-binding IclR family transcriptional regulator|uniref:IclR family transcriptional regulator n=1 Tax=Natronomonas salsuginis TaxID=2217661 RepID=A0A4V5ZP19_9EURY|nr:MULTISPECIES: IclR family transcriptional regulator [Natronomonas]MDR9430174.1 IclR family transcriptional regulator [Natronomonas sp.]TKR26003.1 IclR family transcriptional regulator [Natronomonas salsuginis]